MRLTHLLRFQPVDSLFQRVTGLLQYILENGVAIKCEIR